MPKWICPICHQPVNPKEGYHEQRGGLPDATRTHLECGKKIVEERKEGGR